MRIISGLCGTIAIGLAAPALADAVDDLPNQVVGVIGSGQALSLRFRPVAGEPTRVLSRGDVYADGWVLSNLTPSVATLTKAGESREVGLNPTGWLTTAAPPPSPSEITVSFSTADLAYLEGEISNHRWDGQSFPGLTLDQTRQLQLYDRKIQQARSSNPSLSGPDAFKAALGADYVNYLAAALAMEIGLRQAALDRGDINTVRRMDGLPPVGPEKVLVPTGTSPDAAFRAAGLVSQAGYAEQGPAGSLDANGNRTFTRGTAATGEIPMGQAALAAALGSQTAVKR